MNLTSRGIAGQPRLLIVDDAADALDAWALLLRTEGFAVTTATGGLEGLQQARACRPALIITDLMMPGMDGLALCRALKADPVLKPIPVILWTAATISIVKPVFECFLLKPAAPNILLEHIVALLVKA
ncbi:response regulator transcription factor [Paraburkholderia humisilvae]|nr:response regulator [Paraburkholderia humisilvae]